jgi:hypothetical protein
MDSITQALIMKICKLIEPLSRQVPLLGFKERFLFSIRGCLTLQLHSLGTMFLEGTPLTNKFIEC